MFRVANICCLLIGTVWLDLGFSAAHVSALEKFCWPVIGRFASHLPYPEFPLLGPAHLEAIGNLFSVITEIHEKSGEWRLPTKQEYRKSVRRGLKLDEVYNQLFPNRAVTLLLLKWLGAQRGIPISLLSAEQWERATVDPTLQGDPSKARFAEILRAHFKSEAVAQIVNFVAKKGRLPENTEFVPSNGIYFSAERFFSNDDFREGQPSAGLGIFASRREAIHAVTIDALFQPPIPIRSALLRYRWASEPPSEYLRQRMIEAADELVLNWIIKYKSIPLGSDFGVSLKPMRRGERGKVGITLNQYFGRHEFSIGRASYFQRLHESPREAVDALLSLAQARNRKISFDSAPPIWTNEKK